MTKNPNSGRKSKPPLEVSEAQRSFKGNWHYGGWSDPMGAGDYRSDSDVYQMDMAGYSRGKKQGWPRSNPKVASSDLGKLDRAADRQFKRIKARVSRRYGGIQPPGRSYGSGIQKGHGMRGR